MVQKFYPEKSGINGLSPRDRSNKILSHGKLGMALRAIMKFIRALDTGGEVVTVDQTKIASHITQKSESLDATETSAGHIGLVERIIDPMAMGENNTDLVLTIILAIFLFTVFIASLM